MFDALKALHLLSIGMVAVAMSNAIVGAVSERAGAAAEPALSRLTVIFGKIGRGGLLLLWITGVWMFFDRYGGDFAALPASFRWKLGFVVIATATIVVMDYATVRYRRELGAVAGLTIVLAVILAAFTFN